MKTTLIAAAFLLALAPSIAMADFDTSLKYGSTGPKVLEMQEFLVDQGFMTYQPTGNFFSITLRAVKAFQTAHSVQPVSGFWGPITRGVAQTIIDTELQQSNTEASTTPVATPPTPAPTPVIIQQTPTSSPSPAPTPAPINQTQPTMSTTIEIVVVDDQHQLTDTWKVAPPSVTDPNDATSTSYLALLGAILTNADGSVDRTSTVDVTTDDAAQHAHIVGTGTFWGNPHNTFYYPFKYLFKTAGDHVINFTANGVTESVTLKAQ